MTQTPFRVDRSPEDELNSRVRTLSHEVWEGVVDGADVSRWLDNFEGRALDRELERLHALHLLANFDFFGVKEVREMLKSMYRDLFRYPIIQDARRALGGTREPAALEARFQEERASTRFLGMGNPSESGAHLLYYFRQVNGLPKSLFIHQHEILAHAPGVTPNSVAISGLNRLVFIDDLMGSGDQAAQYSAKLLDFVRRAADESGQSLEICYFTLFARPDAKDRVRALPFDRVDSIHDIDDSERAFSPQSRVYAAPPPEITLAEARSFAEEYGASLFPGHPLGWKDGQLLLGFQHNVPDNTLPIFWLNDTNVSWEPVFPRFTKVYG